jgi:hypothetical protein
VIDRSVFRRTGALALSRTDRGFKTTAARPSTQDRPWASGHSREGSGHSREGSGHSREGQGGRTVNAGEPAAPRPAARDATPRAEDLGPDD